MMATFHVQIGSDGQVRVTKSCLAMAENAKALCEFLGNNERDGAHAAKAAATAKALGELIERYGAK